MWGQSQMGSELMNDRPWLSFLDTQRTRNKWMCPQPTNCYIYIYKRSQAGAILEQPELLPGSIEVPFSEVWKAVRLSDDPCSFSLISVRSFSQQPLVSILEGQTLQSRTILE